MSKWTKILSIFRDHKAEKNKNTTLQLFTKLSSQWPMFCWEKTVYAPHSGQNALEQGAREEQEKSGEYF